MAEYEDPIPHFQLDIVHNQVKEPRSNPKTGRTNCTSKYKEAATEGLERSERQREAACNREGAIWAEKVENPHTMALTWGRLLP